MITVTIDISVTRALRALRDAGYVVVAWAPEEVGEADPEQLESIAIERGNEFLESYANNPDG